MKIKPKVSVIIPVYNAGNKLDRLLDCVAKQTLSDIEVVIVNDGSTDNSQEIIQKYCTDDRRFTSFQQVNQGASAARNTGLKNASGEYVVFYDSDDIVPTDALQKLYKCASDENADMVIGGRASRKHGVDTIHKATAKFVEKETHSKYEKDMALFWGLWNRIFRLDIIKTNNLKFRNLVTGQDGVFLFEYLPFCNIIKSISDVVYLYEKRGIWEHNSLSQNRKKESLNYIMQGYEHVRNSYYHMIENDKPDNGDDLIKEFDSVLAYRTINVNLLNRFYRSMWIADDDAVELAAEQYYKLRELLLPEQLDTLEKTHRDLYHDIPLRMKEDIVKSPSIAVLVINDIQKNDLNDVLLSLYNQLFPKFNVYVGMKMIDEIVPEIRNKSNLFAVGGKTLKQQINNMLKSCDAEMILIVDGAFIYDEMSLRNLVKAMIRDPKLKMAEAMMNNVNVSADKQLEIIDDGNDHGKADICFGNKLIKRESLLNWKTRKLFIGFKWSDLKSRVKCKKVESAVVYQRQM